MSKTFKIRIKRIISLVLLSSILSQLIIPSAYALTSGPTAPEASSFEPVDTTDMVNLLNGNLAYNLPLLEIPGPEGGYPLSLSNHAGIQPNEDASWVGLGWTLNPGAINRNVNGFPDDWMASSASKRDYWEGGVLTINSFGVTIPIGPVASVSFGLSFSNDTYEGNGIGWNLGGTLGIKGTPLSANATVGVTAYGQIPYIGVGIGIGKMIPGSKIGGMLGVSYTTNFESSNFGFSASVFYGSNKYKQQNLLGFSISSSGNSSISVGGVSSSLENKSAGGTRTSTKSTSVDLLLVSWGQEKTRYWSDETMATYITGSLHPNSSYISEIPDYMAYDSYSLQEQDLNVIDHPDPAKQQGGAFPAYDVYQVTAQGLGGTMRPYRFRGSVFAQNKISRIDNNHLRKEVAYINSDSESQPDFRFEGDFSNNYLQTYVDYDELDSRLIYLPAPNSGAESYNMDWEMGIISNKLAGSKSIDYFTTKWDGTVWDNGFNKFITPVVKGLDRIAHTSNATVSKHIAGFSITNESGVTYHYNLPAYSYGEEIYQQRIDTSEGLYFSRQTKGEGYAYTWYLTAVTGPDYVDRGIIGQIDPNDYGYYVSFEYGKWSDNYVWRNPSEGNHINDDANFNMVSMGRKEVYYLNAIRTRSHVAIFEKDVRLDGKGSSPEIFSKNWSSQNNVQTSYNNSGIFNVNSSQSLKLDKIYLLNAEDAELISPSAGGNGNYIPSGRTVQCSNCELPNNVIDKNDVNAVGRSLLESKSIRIIDFNYDNHLARGTSNSFDINTPNVKTGKLSLNAVAFRGKGGASLLPPTKFSYDLDEAYANKSSGRFYAQNYSTTNGDYNVGDLLETADFGTPIFCGMIVAKTPTSSGYNYTLKNGNISGNQDRSAQRTKNPSYNKELYDSWGMYKGDYTASNNENLSRRTTNISNNSTDVWSLKKVSTTLGAEVNINLEGDTYSRSVLLKSGSFIISNFTNQGSNNYYFDVNSGDQDLTELFKVNDKLDLLLLKKRFVRSLVYKPTYFTTINGNSYTEAPIITSMINNRIYIKVNTQMNTDILSVQNNDATYGDVVSIATGNLRFGEHSKNYGGGIRVKNITIDNLSGVKNITNYNYSHLNSSQSSGVTSYEPMTLDQDEVQNIIKTTDASPGTSVEGGDVSLKNYRRALHKGINNLLSISVEAPTPGVMYEYVTTENTVVNDADNIPRSADGKTTFQFEVFRDNMVGRQDVTAPRYKPRTTDYAYYTRNIVLKKFLSSIGSLKRSIVYDKFGNKLKEIVNHSLHDGLEYLPFAEFMTKYEQRLSAYEYQGLIKERYSEVKNVWAGNNNERDIKATLSARESYPAVSTGQTIYDYVLGITTTQTTLAYDFYSGAVTKSLKTDSYGNRIMTEVIPAYKKYLQLGIKLSNTNKNMLSQEAARYTYKVDGNNTKVGLISASVELWSNNVSVLNKDGDQIVQNNLTNGNVWRKSLDYLWAPSGQSPNGITAIGEFTDFDWDNLSSQNPAWKKSSEITLYDVYSKPLEAKDINNHYGSTRMGYNSSRAIVSASLAKYDEIAYSGAEDQLLGNGKFSCNISLGNGIVDNLTAHTGTKSLAINPGGQGFIYQVGRLKLEVEPKDYLVSVWVKPSGGNVSNARLYYQIDGGTPVLNNPVFDKTAAGWYLINMRVPAAAIASSNSTLTIGCKNVGGKGSLNFDDIRFQPLNSTATSYVYDNFSGELTYILDNNNIYTKYQYDAAGRLIKTYREVLGKETIPLINETTYNYGTMFKGNAELSSYFSKDCGEGYLGSNINYVVPAGRYTASTQSAADALAWADIMANGQNFANNSPLGVCSPMVYARVEIVNGYLAEYDGVSETWNDIYVRFYSDYDCTIPLMLNADMDFAVVTTDIHSGYVNQYNSYETIYVGYQGTSEIYLGNFILNSSYMYQNTLQVYDSYYDMNPLPYSLYYTLPPFYN
jgi:hypothetical protein